MKQLLLLVALLMGAAPIPAAEMRGSYDLPYWGSVTSGDEVQVSVTASYVIFDPGKVAWQKTSKTHSEKAFSDDMIVYRAASPDVLTWKVTHSTSGPERGHFVFHFPEELIPVAGHRAALFFTVTRKVSLLANGIRKNWENTTTLPVEITSGPAPGRCLHLERIPDGGMSLMLTPDCSGKASGIVVVPK